MIPEASTDDEAVARAFWAVAEHDGPCFSPFGIDHIREEHPLGCGYSILAQLMPLVTAAHGTNRMAGIYQQDRSLGRPKHEVIIGDYRANIEHMRRGIPDGAPVYGVTIQTKADEFIVAGQGCPVKGCG